MRRRSIATVVRVTGACNAGYQAGDQIIVDLETACIDKRAVRQLLQMEAGI